MSLSDVASPRTVEPNNITSVTVFSFQAMMVEASEAMMSPAANFWVNAVPSETMSLLRASRMSSLLLGNSSLASSSWIFRASSLGILTGTTTLMSSVYKLYTDKASGKAFRTVNSASSEGTWVSVVEDNTRGVDRPTRWKRGNLLQIQVIAAS